MMRKGPAIVFAAEGCTYCATAKQILTKHKIPFQPLDVDLHSERYKQAAALTQVSTVPLIFFGKTFIGGCSDVQALEKEDKLATKFQEETEKGEQQQQQQEEAGEEKKTNYSFLQLPLTEQEQKLESELLKKRQLENNYFSQTAQDVKLHIKWDDDDNNDDSSTSVFTYSELLHEFRFGQNKVKFHDNGLLFKRKEVFSGKDLVDSLYKICVAKSQKATMIMKNQDTSPFLVEIACFLLLGVKMFYLTDSYAFTEKAHDYAVSKELFNYKNLYRFQELAGEIDWPKKNILNGQRLLPSLSPLLASSATSATTSSATSASSKIENTPVTTSDVYFYSQAVKSLSSEEKGQNEWKNRQNFFINRNSTALLKEFNSSSSSTTTTFSADRVSRALYRAQDALHSKYRDASDGGNVDYAAMRAAIKKGQEPLFQELQDISVLLQAVDLSSMKTDEERKQFGINVYNSAVYHGFIVVNQLPWSTLQKMSFFGNTGYLIGGSNHDSNFWSLNDLENGLLRKNSKGVTDFFSSPISASDPRLKVVVEKIDFRIHAGLNCGAKSCPPVKVFSKENLDSELDSAARAFLQSTSSWNSSDLTLTVSQILKWYAPDFAQPTTQDVVLKYLSDEVRAKILKDVKDETSKIKLAYSEYDWNFKAKAGN